MAQVIASVHACFVVPLLPYHVHRVGENCRRVDFCHFHTSTKGIPPAHVQNWKTNFMDFRCVSANFCRNFYLVSTHKERCAKISAFKNLARWWLQLMLCIGTCFGAQKKTRSLRTRNFLVRHLRDNRAICVGGPIIKAAPRTQ